MISEEDIIDQIYTTYYHNVGYWPSEFGNEIDILLNLSRIQIGLSSHPINLSSKTFKSQFKLIREIEYTNNDEYMAGKMNVNID